MRSSFDVTIVSAWFPPEPAPFGRMMFELARHLGAQGMSVAVVTHVPNHPGGRVYGGYRNRLIQSEDVAPNVRVYRLGALPQWTIRGASAGFLHRLVGFVWFTIASSVVVLLSGRSRLLFAVLQPLSVAPFLVAIARLQGAKVVFNVQDLHPDAVIQAGLVRNGVLIAALRAIERFAYRRANSLSVICQSFKQHCITRGARPDEVAVIPNWIDLDEIRPQRHSSSLRREFTIREDSFVVLYAGTIGVVSGAEVLLEAAASLNGDDAVTTVFVGAGPLVPVLAAKAKTLPGTDVVFVPFQPRERLGDVQALGDVCVVTLQAGHGRTSVPSKVLGYMAAGRPVIASVDDDSETARLIHAAGAGWVVPPGNPAALADAIREARREVGQRQSCGDSGRLYLEKNLNQKVVLQQYATLLHEVAGV